MWKAPHWSAARPSRASASRQSTSDRVLGAVALRALGNARDVGLVGLAEVGGEGVRDRAVLAHPGDGAARVEAAREGDADALADRERAEDRRRSASAPTLTPSPVRGDGGTRPRARAPVCGVARRDEDGVVARDRSGDVGQPGGVDRIGERSGEARAVSARRAATRTASARPPSAERRRSARRAAPEIGRAGKRVHEPAFGVADLDETELRDVARDGRLHGFDARRAQRLGDLRLRRQRLLAGRAGESSPAARTSSSREHLREQVECERRLVGGERQRRRQAERLLAGAADHEAVLERGRRPPGAAGRSSSTASSRPSPRTSPRAARPAEAAPRSRARARAARRRPCRRLHTLPRRRRGCRRTSRRGRRARSRSAPRRRRGARRSAARSRGPSRASPRRARRRSAARRRTRRCARRPSAPRRESASRRARPRARAPAASVSGGERMHAALALHGLEQDRCGLRADVLGECLRRREDARPGRAARTLRASPAAR